MMKSNAEGDFPTLGVKVEFFQEFIESSLKGGEEIQQYTTAEVCEKIVKFHTKASGLSIAQMLSNEGSSYVSTANVFISHAWRYNFCEVAKIIRQHFKNRPETFVWFDIFSNNQHDTSEHNFDWWATTFKSAIKRFGYTLLILSPWDKLLPLSRAWCLYEIYCTIVNNVTFEIALGDQEGKRLFDALMEERTDLRSFKIIQTEKSESLKPSDADTIKKVVQKDLKFDKLNLMISSKLLELLIAMISLEISHENNNFERKCKLMLSMAYSYLLQSNEQEAKKVYDDCAQYCKAKLGTNHEIILGLNETKQRHTQRVNLVNNTRRKSLNSTDNYMKSLRTSEDNDNSNSIELIPLRKSETTLIEEGRTSADSGRASSSDFSASTISDSYSARTYLLKTQKKKRSCFNCCFPL